MGRLGRMPLPMRLGVGVFVVLPLIYFQYAAWSGKRSFEQFQDEQRTVAEQARSMRQDDEGPTYEERMQADAERRHAERLAFEQDLARRTEQAHAGRSVPAEAGMGTLKRVGLGSTLVGILALAFLAAAYALRTLFSNPPHESEPDGSDSY